MDLFDFRFHFPNSPGFKRAGTSEEAAKSMAGKAQSKRDRCFSCLTERPMTADQVADALGESILTIRPRISELVAMGCIRDTGRTAPNDSGKQAVIWETCGAKS